MTSDELLNDRDFQSYLLEFYYDGESHQYLYLHEIQLLSTDGGHGRFWRAEATYREARAFERDRAVNTVIAENNP